MMASTAKAPLLALQQDLVYGPVHSRRLGLSLGLNVLPPTTAGTPPRGKTCTFDCAYCQYGWTRPDSLADLRTAPFPTVDDILTAVEIALANAAAPPAFLTFSGNGEPTLHPAFGAIVDGLARLRDRLAPAARIALLSNASTLADPTTRAAVARVDVRILKLDAGTEATFRRFLRPLTAVTLEDILGWLRTVGDVTIQSLFCGGTGGNSAPAEIAAWAARIRELRPVAVQVYSVARGYPARDIEPLDAAHLRAIAAHLDGSGIPVQTY